MRRQGARFTPGAPRRQRRTERGNCREKHDQGRDRDAKRLPHLAEVQSLALLGTVCVSAPVDSHFGRIDVDTAIEAVWGFQNYELLIHSSYFRHTLTYDQCM